MAERLGRSAVATVVRRLKYQSGCWHHVPFIGAVAVITFFLTWKFSKDCGGGASADEKEGKAGGKAETTSDESDDNVLDSKTQLEIVEQELQLFSTTENISINPVLSDRQIFSFDVNRKRMVAAPGTLNLPGQVYCQREFENQSPVALYQRGRLRDDLVLNVEDKLEDIHESADVDSALRWRHSLDASIKSGRGIHRKNGQRLSFTSEDDVENISFRPEMYIPLLNRCKAGDTVTEEVVTTQNPNYDNNLTALLDASSIKYADSVTSLVVCAADMPKNDIMTWSPKSSETDLDFRYTSAHAASDENACEGRTLPSSISGGGGKYERLAHPFTQSTDWLSTSSKLDYEEPINASVFMTKMARTVRVSEPCPEASKNSPRGEELESMANTWDVYKEWTSSSTESGQRTRYCSSSTADKVSHVINGTPPGNYYDQVRRDDSYRTHNVDAAGVHLGPSPFVVETSEMEKPEISSSRFDRSERQRSYDEYLADPELSPTMKSQVLRAKSSLARYFDDTDGE